MASRIVSSTATTLHGYLMETFEVSLISQGSEDKIRTIVFIGKSYNMKKILEIFTNEYQLDDDTSYLMKMSIDQEKGTISLYTLPVSLKLGEIFIDRADPRIREIVNISTKELRGEQRMLDSLLIRARKAEVENEMLRKEFVNKISYVENRSRDVLAQDKQGIVPAGGLLRYFTRLSEMYSSTVQDRDRFERESRDSKQERDRIHLQVKGLLTQISELRKERDKLSRENEGLKKDRENEPSVSRLLVSEVQPPEEEKEKIQEL